MQAIGIDIGTTSICGVVLENGKLVRSKTVNYDAFIKTASEWEKIQDVDKIMNVAFGVLSELITDKTSVIGVTGQMHGIVYTDKDGVAVSPLYTWQDGRGNLPYNDTTYAGYLNSYSGYGAVTDFYNRENRLVDDRAIAFCTIHDYFVMRLCGLKTPIIHLSDACSFGLYDLAKNTFLFDYNGKVTDDYAIVGSYDGIPVSVAIGDNQASVFSTLTDNDDLLINAGTGSQVSIVTDKIANIDGVETRPYVGGKYLLVGAVLCGGRAYSMLKDFYASILREVVDISDKEVYQIIDKLLKCSDDKLTVDTRFAGTRANPKIKGSISGIDTVNFTPSALARGFIDGMAEELYNVYLKMGERKSGIVGSGNGIRKNPIFKEAIEEKFGVKMKIPKHQEEAAFGCALFALIAVGEYKDAEEAHRCIRYE